MQNNSVNCQTEFVIEIFYDTKRELNFGSLAFNAFSIKRN
jgi:hypothetical protein